MQINSPAEDNRKNADSVSIIIPTLCLSERAALLKRAINSALNQSNVALELLVVVNGNKFEQELLSMLETDKRLRIIQIEQPNVSAARYAGICQANGDFFCFLDDDDELIPDTLYHRLSLFYQYDNIDVAVTNGFLNIDGKDFPNVKLGRAEEINKQPGECFLRGNWFASSSALFRTETVDPELFNICLKYFELTYLFFILLSKGKIFHYDEAMSYRLYGDNPLSISKSKEYFAAYPDFLLTLLELPLAGNIKSRINENYLTALNLQSNYEMTQGMLKSAWRVHLKCLLKGGWKYLFYTRHLLVATFCRKSGC